MEIQQKQSEEYTQEQYLDDLFPSTLANLITNQTQMTSDSTLHLRQRLQKLQEYPKFLQSAIPQRTPAAIPDPTNGQEFSHSRMPRLEPALHQVLLPGL